MDVDVDVDVFVFAKLVDLEMGIQDLFFPGLPGRVRRPHLSSVTHYMIKVK